MINVLVVEDSVVVREFLVHILSSDPDIRVVGTARNGEEALEMVRAKRPDVITMDIHMPKMGGLEATRKIMEIEPVPIIIVSGSADPKDVALTFGATEAGAVAFLHRPTGMGHPDCDHAVKELVKTIKLMSEVKVVRRWPKARGETAGAKTVAGIPQTVSRIRVVALGSSTGGPPAIQTILSGLPENFPAPVLIVQHMAQGFIQGFVEWLAQSCRLKVHIAINGETILPGHAYVAPDDCQMKVGYGGKILLTDDGKENGIRPSISYLFRSVGQIYGSGAVAGLLTGMGRDGADELKSLKELGAVTIAQDKESSVVYGMPGEAVRLDAATLVLNPEKIAPTLINLVNRPGN